MTLNPKRLVPLASAFLVAIAVIVAISASARALIIVVVTAAAAFLFCSVCALSPRLHI